MQSRFALIYVKESLELSVTIDGVDSDLAEKALSSGTINVVISARTPASRWVRFKWTFFAVEPPSGLPLMSTESDRRYLWVTQKDFFDFMFEKFSEVIP
jgi:hypothetical protein